MRHLIQAVLILALFWLSVWTVSQIVLGLAGWRP